MTYGAEKKRRTKKNKTKLIFLPFKIFLVLLFGLFVWYSLFNLVFNHTDDATEASSSSVYDPYENVPLHSYNWDNLSVSPGRIEYTDDKGVKALQGVDISHYQGNIDWQKVKASGISFAMLRIGYRGYESGKIIQDTNFIQNMNQALSAGIHVGVYFFSQAITEEEAIEEADFVLQSIDGYKVTYPLVFDLEEISSSDHRAYNLTKEQRTKIAIAFCKRIESAGYTPMIYGNGSWLTDCYDLNQISDFDIWLAQYANCPTFPYNFKMWQYTNAGYVDGINHVVDIDLCFEPYNKN